MPSCGHALLASRRQNGPMMADRALDFRMKGLPADVRQELFCYLHYDISETTILWFLEKEAGYPSFRSCGFSEGDIELIGESYVEKFEHPNQVLAEHGRPPLFSDPHDSFKSAQQYEELMKLRSKEELRALFGCTFAEYQPNTLPQNDSENTEPPAEAALS